MGATLLTSCNKKLKEELNDLEKSVNDEKAKNEALQNQLNTLNGQVDTINGQVGTINGVLIRKPISMTFSTSNSTGALSHTASYPFVYGSDYGYSYIEDNGNGTYYVYVERAGDLGTDFDVVIEFTYNPTTNTVTFPYLQTQGYFSNGNYFYAEFNGSTNITQTITVSSFNFNAGTISFTYSGSTTAAYSNNAYTNQPMTATASYSGPMAKYTN
jgi:hypothetical protein